MHKLVRDKVVDNILNRNAKLQTKILNDIQFLNEIKKKLQEEVDELMEVDNLDKKNLINELADIELLIDYILKVVGITRADLTKKQINKVSEVGAFNKRIFVEKVSLQDNDKWIEYYKKKGFKEEK